MMFEGRCPDGPAAAPAPPPPPPPPPSAPGLPDRRRFMVLSTPFIDMVGECAQGAKTTQARSETQALFSET